MKRLSSAELQAPVASGIAQRPCTSCDGSGVRHPENDGSQFNCYDCHRSCSSYMVRDYVWRAAWPDYAVLRRDLLRKYRGTSESFRTHLSLCLSCLGKRLGRQLSQDDFDLTLPINSTLVLGIQLGLGLKDKDLAHEMSQVPG